MTEREVRRFSASFEVRGLSGSDVELTGYASTFNQPYDMHDRYGQYREHVAPTSIRSGSRLPRDGRRALQSLMFISDPKR